VWFDGSDDAEIGGCAISWFGMVRDEEHGLGS
jgi:hypothetical protein